MYNDSWPVTHGWTIVDYYLRKKLAYYPVKKAFNSIAVVISSEDDKINCYGVNDSPADWAGQLKYGLFATKGGLPIDEKADVKLQANQSTLLKSIKKEEWNQLGLAKHGASASLTTENGNPVNQYKLLLTKFKDLDLALPKIAVTRKGDFAIFTSSAFVWGASIDVDGEADLPNNCFDLIPGVPYKIAWPKDKKLPVVIRTGNDLFREMHKLKNSIMVKMHIQQLIKTLFLIPLFFLGTIQSCFSQLLSTANQHSLNGVWQVTWSSGGHGSTNIEEFKVLNSSKDPGRYLDVPVPMELHKALEEKGFIDDMYFGINSLKAQWVANQYWQYQTTFILPKASSGKQLWLFFKQLDINAHIYLNGVLVGTHLSANRPCRINVTDKVKEGENRLIVAIESGLHWVSEKSGKDYAEGLDTWLNKRIWLRKPQYQFLWDWNPKLINVGITGDVSLEWAEKARPDQSVAYVSLNNDLTEANITFRIFIEGLESGSLELTAAIEGTSVSSTEKFDLKKGINPYDLNLHLSNPALWWPVGQGSQFQYNINYTIRIDGKIINTGQKRLGIRKVEIDQPAHPVAGRYFIIKVNNRPIFLKGGNWVPADMIYSSVTRERLSKLVDLAIGANFNMLRVWGGGTWAGNDLLELCDEKGILVWHDFLFAVNKYPGDDPAFLEEVKKEVTWGTREFAHHASLALWCGNNEQEWAVWEWAANSGRSLPDYAIYHHIMPVILKTEDPYRPYWPSSPFSPDHEYPNSPLSGDQHPWDITLGKDGPNFWAYRDRVDRFPNEGGVLGASSPATIHQFLPDNEKFMRSFSWEHHDNSSNFPKDTVGVAYKMIDYWLGKSPREMGLDNYLYASALLHAEGLTEYISNYRRRMFSSSAAIFWMYNDSWPVTLGWTIVDYYLRKKLAYYPVKRAFNPIAVVITSEDDKINFYGVNDSPDDWEGQLRYGLFATKGGLRIDEKDDVNLPANQSTLLKSIKKEEWTKLGLANHGAFASLTSVNGTQVNQYKLLLTKFKDLDLALPKIAVTRKGDFIEFTTSAFVWGVSIDVNGEADLPDNCFDLIPGVPYKIAWPKDKKLPVVIRTGNELIVK